MRRKPARVAILALIAALTTIGPADANVITRTDGNDTPGPLDMSSLRIEHRSNLQVFTITTLDGYDLADISGENGFFEVDFDVDGDKDWDYYAVVWFEGKMRAVLGRPGGGVIDGTLPVGRPASNRVWVGVSKGLIGNPRSYDVAAFSVHFAAPCTNTKPCVDSIPNNYPLIRHDLTPPWASFRSFSDVSSDMSAWLTVPVLFWVQDDEYGSGVDRWVFDIREFGSTAWKREAAGTSTHPTVKIDLKEGKTYYLRVTAWDRQGNRGVSTAKISAPTDDARAMFDYTGDWDRLTDEVGAFLRTLHKGAAGAELKVTLPGDPSKVCVLLGATTGPRAQAELRLDGMLMATLRENGDTGDRQLSGCYPIREMGKTVVLKLTPISGEPFVFDGIVIKR